MVCILSTQTSCTENHFRQCMNASGTVIYWRLGAMVFQWQDVENQSQVDTGRDLLAEVCKPPPPTAGESLHLKQVTFTGVARTSSTSRISSLRHFYSASCPRAHNYRQSKRQRNIPISVTWLCSPLYTVSSTAEQLLNDSQNASRPELGSTEQ